MIVVGNLNILKGNSLKHEERVPFVIDLLQTLMERGAYKTFITKAQPEKQVGAIRDADLPMQEPAKKKNSKEVTPKAGLNEVSSNKGTGVKLDPALENELQKSVKAMGLQNGESD
jgi:hypothetical protein